MSKEDIVVNNGDGSVTIYSKKPTPPKKRYWKVHDIFIREFGWAKDYPQMLHLKKKDQAKVKIDYSLPFNETMKMLKNKFNLSNEETSSFNYSLEYDILRLEKTKYKNKKILSQIYNEIFDKKKLKLFIDNTEYILKNIENFEKDFKINDENGALVYHQHRTLINSILGICFEYACKALVLSKGYYINEHNSGKKPIKKVTKKTKFNPTRTLGLETLWNFILEKRFLKFTKYEKTTGNYLCFLRNLCAHLPLSPASRGNYNKLSIELIKKMLKECNKEYFYFLGGKK